VLQQFLASAFKGPNIRSKGTAEQAEASDYSERIYMGDLGKSGKSQIGPLAETYRVYRTYQKQPIIYMELGSGPDQS
jgi:hypothetical protein